jgi:hypothetical protein
MTVMPANIQGEQRHYCGVKQDYRHGNVVWPISQRGMDNVN